MTCGIYAIINIKNIKLYVGSGKCIERRIRWKDPLKFVTNKKKSAQVLKNKMEVLRCV
jgi:23S rRNA A2030 N6-methylase RlmJ